VASSHLCCFWLPCRWKPEDNTLEQTYSPDSSRKSHKKPPTFRIRNSLANCFCTSLVGVDGRSVNQVPSSFVVHREARRHGARDLAARRAPQSSSVACRRTPAKKKMAWSHAEMRLFYIILSDPCIHHHHVRAQNHTASHALDVSSRRPIDHTSRDTYEALPAVTAKGFHRFLLFSLHGCLAPGRELA